MFTPERLKTLIDASTLPFRDLSAIYARLPQTHCHRQALCCSLLPEMTFLEGLLVLKKMGTMPAPSRLDLIKGIIRYFFINPVEITACPFLKDRECLIYPERFFGCRAYGLWSSKIYDEMVAQSRRAKMVSREQWLKLGVTLPKKVIEFQVPYCSWVQSVFFVPIDDDVLFKVWDDIEAQSQNLHSAHFLFKDRFLSDLSFLLAGLTFGFGEALQLKLSFVREFLNTGSAERLEYLIDQCFDPLAETGL